MHKHMRSIWRSSNEQTDALWRSRLIKYRTEPVITRLVHPTRLDRAHALGYKAKQGFAIARVKIIKGKRMKPKPAGGRKPKHAGRFFTLSVSKRVVAEQKAARKYPNMEVIGSYYLTEDGTHQWFEIILADRVHPAVTSSKETGWIGRAPRGRAFRATTSAGRKSRGLYRKGKGAEKVRPSLSATLRKRQAEK